MLHTVQIVESLSMSWESSRRQLTLALLHPIGAISLRVSARGYEADKTHFINAGLGLVFRHPT